MPKTTRCINLDWLEVHCFESPANFPCDAQYFRSRGYVVNEREYGTRVYREMFVVLGSDGQPFVEVRRNPASQGYMGIHAEYECHLRLPNAVLYQDNAAATLAGFMMQHGYQFQRIARVDICLDFEKFDRGDDPQKFLKRYLQNTYAKINQGNISAHGADRWSGQQWNSVAWGSLVSDIGTKFYNKTLELYDPATRTYKKPYIRYAWFRCGLIDDFHKMTKHDKDGKEYTPNIWRVEFSIRSSVKKWFKIELNGKERAYQSIRNTLDMYDSREKLLALFAALANHYFHFKVLLFDRKVDKDGKETFEARRKDRCPDKELFIFKGQQYTYKIDRDPIPGLLGDSRKVVNPLDGLLHKLKVYAASHTYGDVHEACQVLIKAIEGETLRTDMRNPFSLDELRVLQQTLAQKTRGNQADVTILMQEIKALLKINDNTAIF